MKKWLLLVLIVLLASGCSWQKIKKYLDEAEWERNDRTIRVADFLLK